jgi:hypothetical protein
VHPEADEPLDWSAVSASGDLTELLVETDLRRRERVHGVDRPDLGLTRERIRQLEPNAMARLANELEGIVENDDDDLARSLDGAAQTARPRRSTAR